MRFIDRIPGPDSMCSAWPESYNAAARYARQCEVRQRHTGISNRGRHSRPFSAGAHTFDAAQLPSTCYARRMSDFTAVEQPIHERLVDAIRDHINPELILLFGSRALGGAREDSDYDLMVVLRDGSDLERHRRDACHAVHAIGVGADVLVRSVSDYQRRQADPGFLDWLVSREGVLLYSSGVVQQRSAGPARVREESREGLRAWIERAAEDFRAAELSMAPTDPAPGAICFHAHACAEKLLKALMVRRGRHPPRTHALPELLSLQGPSVRADKALIAACALLEALYPSSRYPEEPLPTLDEARRALDSARLVRDRLLPLLSPT
jgi:HEPN domain-containing protein